MPSVSRQLFLHEELFLLALQDDKGTIAAGTWYSFAMGGAVLAELVLTGRVKIEDEGKKKTCRLASPLPFGNEVIDQCLGKMKDSGRQREPSQWIGKFAYLPKLKELVALELCNKKILQADEKTVLWLFSKKIYPERDPAPEQEIVERVRQAIFTEKRDVDPRTAMLTILASATEILPVVFDRKHLKSRTDRLEKLASGELIGDATREAVEAMQAAMFVAVIIPTIITPTIINS